MKRLLILLILSCSSFSAIADQNYCKSVAVETAVEVINMNLGMDLFEGGYIDSSKSENRLEEYYVVLNDGTIYPDGEDAFILRLDSGDNCNFVDGYNAYSNKVIYNPYE